MAVGMFGKRTPSPDLPPPQPATSPAAATGSNWIWDLWKEQWQHVSKAKLPFFVCLSIVSGIVMVATYWFVDRLYSAESKAKDATIAGKETIISLITTQ